MITRIRHGLATNSSSSHSMVLIAPADQPPEMIPDPMHFKNGYRISTEASKRRFLAGMLRDQSPVLWGRGVLMNPDQLPELPRWQKHQDGLNQAEPGNFDSRAADHVYELFEGEINLPKWISDEIRRLCSLPEGSDISGLSSENSFGWAFTIPRNEAGMGPDPVAWEAILGVVLDPSTVLFCPEENSWDPEVEGGEHINHQQHIKQTILSARSKI